MRATRSARSASSTTIEVYLAYQVKLRDVLQLLHIAPNMRLFAVSHVTEHDIAAAETSVRNQEATGFADYLATRWQPRETVVSRIAPRAYEVMQERLLAAMGDEFNSRLAQRLAEHGLTATPMPSGSSVPRSIRKSPARSRAH